MKEHVFSAWAPEGADWSRWVKPVLFAHLDEDPGAPDTVVEPAVPISWLVPSEDLGYRQGPRFSLSELAAIVDLPGARGPRFALRLASLGMRPVPLYNGLPGPAPYVDVVPIQRALAHGAEDLRTLALKASASPAFLLDANRNERSGQLVERFDNRWVVFASDFPSADLLLARGVRRIILFREGPLRVPNDLVPILSTFRRAGLELYAKNVDSAAPPGPCALPRGVSLRRIWIERIVPLALGRRATGEFGAWIPKPQGG